MELVTKVICEGYTFYVYKVKRGFWLTDRKTECTTSSDNKYRVYSPCYDTLDDALDAAEKQAEVKRLVKEQHMSVLEAATKVFFG